MSLPADYAAAREAAVRLLLKQRLYGLRVDVTKLRYEQTILFDSVRRFCETTCTTIAQLTEQSGCLEDGCTIVHQRNGQTVYIVLYNDAKRSLARRRFTLAHEIGHILLEHGCDGDRQEAEANCFAAELLAPRVLVHRLLELSDTAVFPEDLHDRFGISLEAARLRLRHQSNSRPIHFSESENALLEKLGGLLEQPFRSGE